MPEIVPLSPRQTFEDNMRPAHLLLRVYRLLDSDDNILRDGTMMASMRQVIHAEPDEELMLIVNEVFLGLVRERASLHSATFKRKSLCHMLRQSVVASATAMETYLASSLRQYLPGVIAVRKRQFFPSDRQVTEYFKGMTYTLDETLRIMESETPEKLIADKILGFIDNKYLSRDTGVHICGALLGVVAPWKQIAEQLQRPEEDLRKTLNGAMSRRNDIVHRADRSDKDPGGEPQEIPPTWAKQAVDTIDSVILTFDDEVNKVLRELNLPAAEILPEA